MNMRKLSLIMNTLLLFSTVKVMARPAIFMQPEIKRLAGHNIAPRPTHDKMIALTFDDGPTPKVTNAILSILDEYNVPATFFVIGKKAKTHTSLIERAFHDGHIIANHSYSHKYIGKVSKWKFRQVVKEEFFNAHKVIEPYLGNSIHPYYRAPGASWKDKAATIINKTAIGKDYIGPVMWNVGGEVHKNSQGVYTSAADWACWSKKMSVNQCLEGYINRTEKTQGGIVLMHDLNPKTISLLRQYIPVMLKKGYTFVKLSTVLPDKVFYHP